MIPRNRDSQVQEWEDMEIAKRCNNIGSQGKDFIWGNPVTGMNHVVKT